MILLHQSGALGTDFVLYYSPPLIIPDPILFFDEQRAVGRCIFLSDLYSFYIKKKKQFEHMQR